MYVCTHSYEESTVLSVHKTTQEFRHTIAAKSFSLPRSESADLIVSGYRSLAFCIVFYVIHFLFGSRSVHWSQKDQIIQWDSPFKAIPGFFRDSTSGVKPFFPQLHVRLDPLICRLSKLLSTPPPPPRCRKLCTYSTVSCKQKKRKKNITNTVNIIKVYYRSYTWTKRPLCNCVYCVRKGGGNNILVIV